MSEIQIYYLIPVQLNKGLLRQNIDLSQILRQGDKTIDEVQSEIKAEPDFCREQDAIEFNYLYTSLNNTNTGGPDVFIAKYPPSMYIYT